MGDRNDGSYRGLKYETPSRFQKYDGPYAIHSDELQDLKQLRQPPIYHEVLDLRTAQAVTSPKIINVPGRAVVIYGVTFATLFEPSLGQAGGGVETVVSTVVVDCRIEEDLPEASYMLKHNRGYRGLFTRLFLSWPAQSNNVAHLYVLKYDGQPWQSGEAAT